MICVLVSHPNTELYLVGTLFGSFINFSTVLFWGKKTTKMTEKW